MMARPDTDVVNQFLEHVKKHSMAVELDNGVHRSLKFSRNNSSVFYFRITTWPGHLCISGDMGTYVFARLEDMFQFFRGDDLKINPGYWAEKLQSISCYGSKEGCVREFDPAATLENVRSALEGNGKAEEILEEVEECSEAEEVLRILDGYAVSDAWDLISRTYTFHFLWCLYAIRWAISQFDRQAEAAA